MKTNGVLQVRTCSLKMSSDSSIPELDDDLVIITNKLFESLGLHRRISHRHEIGASVFVMLYEHLFGERVPNRLERPHNRAEEEINAQAVIDSLAGDILNTSLSHITGNDLVNQNPVAIHNILEIISGLADFILEKVHLTPSQGNTALQNTCFRGQEVANSVEGNSRNLCDRKSYFDGDDCLGSDGGDRSLDSSDYPLNSRNARLNQSYDELQKLVKDTKELTELSNKPRNAVARSPLPEVTDNVISTKLKKSSCRSHSVALKNELTFQKYCEKASQHLEPLQHQSDKAGRFDDDKGILSSNSAGPEHVDKLYNTSRNLARQIGSNIRSSQRGNGRVTQETAGKDIDHLLQTGLHSQLPHLDLTTLGDMWQCMQADFRKHRGKIELSKFDEECKRRELLLHLIHKEISHNDRLYRVQQTRRLRTANRNRTVEKRIEHAQLRRHYQDYLDRHKSKMLCQLNQQELSLQELFKQQLKIHHEEDMQLRKDERERQKLKETVINNQQESLENYCHDQFNLLAEAIEKEKHEVTLRHKARKRIIDKMKRSLKQQKEDNLLRMNEKMLRES